MPAKPNNKSWLKKFAFFLSGCFKILGIGISAWANENNISEPAVRCWISGRNLPSEDILVRLCQEISEKETGPEERCKLYETAVEVFSDTDFANRPQELRASLLEAKIAPQVLRDLWLLTKGKKIEREVYLPTGKSQVVIFDFDGTLVYEDNKTTWERLWMLLGYQDRDCQKLHQQFNDGKISHKEWCSLTSNRFKEKGLTREQVKSLGRVTQPLDGVNETFKELASRGLKIFIVSGSISDVIKEALDGALQYVDELKCNIFDYDDNGYFRRIVGTRYDFAGKAEFIRMKAEELEISCRDILFVGNSINDRFAYSSGARTLCINPRLTDITNKIMWNNVIQSCSDLREILPFLDYDV